MGIDWDAIQQAGGYGKGQSAREAIRARKLTKKELLDEAYDVVDQLDGGVCWVTGRTTVKASADSRNRRERHHLAGRRVKPEWRHDPNRIITLCAEAHQLITEGKLDVEGDDRRKPLFFHWTTKPEHRPFHILEKRLRKAQAS